MIHTDHGHEKRHVFVRQSITATGSIHGSLSSAVAHQLEKTRWKACIVFAAVFVLIHTFVLKNLWLRERKREAGQCAVNPDPSILIAASSSCPKCSKKICFVCGFSECSLVSLKILLPSNCHKQDEQSPDLSLPSHVINVINNFTSKYELECKLREISNQPLGGSTFTHLFISSSDNVSAYNVSCSLY